MTFQPIDISVGAQKAIVEKKALMLAAFAAVLAEDDDTEGSLGWSKMDTAKREAMITDAIAAELAHMDDLGALFDTRAIADTGHAGHVAKALTDLPPSNAVESGGPSSSNVISLAPHRGRKMSK